MATVAREFNLTRERVRQIIMSLGVIDKKGNQGEKTLSTSA